jgi:cytochrome c-type biogenesis protein CcmH
MKWLVVVLVLFSVNVQAVIEAFEFDSDEKRELFQQLSEELRCPKCQNQNLADSNAAIAQDLRNELYKMVAAGKNTSQIKDFMVDRYGQFVLYKPRVNPLTYALWYGPFVLLFGGLIIVLLISRKRKVKTPISVTSDNEQQSQTTVNHSVKSEHDERLQALMVKKSISSTKKSSNKELDKS